MFTKMKAKPTLVETYQEAERVEAERETIEHYPDPPGKETTDRRALLLSKHKEDHSLDYQGMLKMM